MKNHLQQTVFHAAASYGNLHQLPDRLLTRENLLEADKLGFTAVDMATQTGHLNQVPRALRDLPANLVTAREPSFLVAAEQFEFLHN
jgi:ankyrin repeat protein